MELTHTSTGAATLGHSLAPTCCSSVSRLQGTAYHATGRPSRIVRSVGLVVIDEIHLLGADRGPILEVIVSRMRYISAHTSRHIRIVGLSTGVGQCPRPS